MGKLISFPIYVVPPEKLLSHASFINTHWFGYKTFKLKKS